MGACNINHSSQDVFIKLQSQRAFMPESLFDRVTNFLQGAPVQDVLNALFHLLKKYDLVSSEEQENRNKSMIRLLSGGN